MEGLDFDNILGADEIDNLFAEPEDKTTEETVDKTSEETKEELTGKENENNETTTTEVENPDDLFLEEEQPESVGSEKNKEDKEKEGTSTDEDSGSSPNDNFYSSIANALAVDGIFPNLDEETITKADSAEALSDLIEAEVAARLNDKQQRVAKALENGVEASDIRKYEGTLSYIDSVTEAQIAEESEKGEQIRRNFIYQDLVNKGYTPEKAQKLTERAFDNGTDIEDAKEALQSNREFFQKKYNELLKEAQKEADAERETRKQQAKEMRNSIMEDKDLLGSMELSKDVRKKAFENISKPIYKDPETGEYLTALQKYEMEHKAELLKYTGLIFTLTNGFKDFKSFAKGEVKKELKKGLRDLEKTLNNTSRTKSGNLKMVTSKTEDPESYFLKGMNLDI